MTSEIVRIASCNFEGNGKSVRELQAAMWGFLRNLELDAPALQEEWRSYAGGYQEAHLAEEALGMRRAFPPASACALHVKPDMFHLEKQVTTAASKWGIQPTVYRARLRGTSAGSMPLLLGSIHLRYNPALARATEAEEVTGMIDEYVDIDGVRRLVPSFIAGDMNSPAVPHPLGGPGKMDLDLIEDTAHRAHRSRLLDDGTRVPDTWPDRILRDAGLCDVDAYAADRALMEPELWSPDPLRPTVWDDPSQGPGQRVDRAHISAELLPAVRNFRVEEPVVGGVRLSDHKVLLVDLHRPTLLEILGNPALHRRKPLTAVAAAG